MRKTVHYRRVVWLSKNKWILKDLLDQILTKLPTVADTKFEYRSNVNAQISARKVGKAATGIYFTLFNEGSPAATVENGVGNIRKRKAPKGEEFLRTGIMLVVSDNHVAFLADGHTNDGQIASLIHRLFKEKKFPDSTTQFLLQPRANIKQLKKLLADGVKSIDMGLLSFAATAEQLEQKGKNAAWLRPLVIAGEQIANAIGKDRTDAEKEAASEVEISIHLGYDGRISDGTSTARLLADLATGVQENADQFRIVTSNDNIITHEKLVIKAEVEVAGDDIASDPISAFEALIGALAQWKREGVLDQ